MTIQNKLLAEIERLKKEAINEYCEGCLDQCKKDIALFKEMLEKWYKELVMNNFDCMMGMKSNKSFGLHFRNFNEQFDEALK